MRKGFARKEPFMRVSKCLLETKPYLFVELSRKRAALEERGIDVVSLSVGDPDRPTPEFIVDAMVDALHDPAFHHYPSYAGSMPKTSEANKRKRLGSSRHT